MSYDYNSPSRLNWVSLLFGLVIAGGAYGAVKFAPVYWQGKKVDRELDELRLRAVDFARLDDANRRQVSDEIVAKAIAALHDLGIEDQVDQPIQVWFSPDFGELHARYQIVVTHPAHLVKPTVMNMERVVVVQK
jgi:hypothetical protein